MHCHKVNALELSSCCSTAYQHCGKVQPKTLNPCDVHVQGEALQVFSTLLKASQSQQQQLVVAALQQNLPAFAAAMCHAVTGPFKTTDRHSMAVQLACSCVESAKKLQPGKRLAAALGPDMLTGLAKSVVTVKVRFFDVVSGLLWMVLTVRLA